MPTTAPTLLTVAEAGERLGVSSSTVWRLIRRGALKSVRRAGRRLIPEDAVESATSAKDGEAVPALTEEHPIFRLLGAGRSGGLGPGARDKHDIARR